MISQSKKHRSGFTLVELMITLLVLAIILGIALPSFSALIEKLAIRSTTESIVEALRTARVTAVEEQTDIKVCGLGANNTCSNADWDKGLIILRNSNSETLYLIRSTLRRSSTADSPTRGPQQAAGSSASWGPPAPSRARS